MKSRFSFGGDEHILCECADEMSFEAFFKSLSTMRALREAEITGLIEVSGGNSSYLVRVGILINANFRGTEVARIGNVAERQVVMFGWLAERRG